MVAKLSEFENFVTELLADLGPVQIKRMFGGAGVYAQDVMFGLIADDQLYLKADSDLKTRLEDEGCYAFEWTRPIDGKVMEMSYVSLPESALDDADEAVGWARDALSVALASRKPKRKPKKKPNET